MVKLLNCKLTNKNSSEAELKDHSRFLKEIADGKHEYFTQVYRLDFWIIILNLNCAFLIYT